MPYPQGLLEGRKLFENRAWSSAYAVLADVDDRSPLAVEDVELLGTAAFLAGLDRESDAAWTRAFHARQEAGDNAGAVRCAFWLAFRLLNAGDLPQGAGWVVRIRRLLERCADGPEHGYGRYTEALHGIFSGDLPGAAQAFSEAAEVGVRSGDQDLTTLAQVGQARSLIYLGDVADGVELLDEAMVAVTADEVSPVIVGDTYCTVIDACTELFDLSRVQAWTSALSAWCDTQPELVPFRGLCMVHRAVALQLSGDWPAALAEARRACTQLSVPVERPAAGEAHYQYAEMHRLRGEFATAESAYQRAGAAGRDPQPGLALLRLAQGDHEGAAASVRRALDEAGGAVARARLLPAQVAICLADGDVESASTAAAELAETAATLRAPMLRALAGTADGQVLLADGEPGQALNRLRTAASLWSDLGVPYELALVREQIGDACRALGDRDGAKLELDAARSAFAALGALPDLARLQPSEPATPLSARETEVIRRIAAGESNRDIAASLVISERTVERHVSNIFAKLDVSSRAAATAYAYQHRIV